MKIEWLISGKKPSWEEENYRTGGYVYTTYARRILREHYELSVTYLPRGNAASPLKRIIQFAAFLNRCRRFQYKGDIVFRDVYTTAFAPFDSTHKHIVILHHLDPREFSSKAVSGLVIRRFFRNVRRADKVVVVSEYWKKVMEKAGCSDVEVIYNSFDLELFRFNSSELQSLKQRLNLSEHKPLIYLGNARPDKGFLDSYQSLKDLEATFVATGKNEHSDQLPVRTFYLSYKNYLRILKLSTLAITMSVFDEGWCRTAHEAMLCGTPVVGSGRGGMQELLEKGGQVICQDFSLLDRVVKSLLSDKKKRDEMSRKGREFASRFNLDYFREKFLALVSF